MKYLGTLGFRLGVIGISTSHGQVYTPLKQDKTINDNEIVIDNFAGCARAAA